MLKLVLSAMCQNCCDLIAFTVYLVQVPLAFLTLGGSGLLFILLISAFWFHQLLVKDVIRHIRQD